jgi:DNA-binding transcriptional ArsR family regulator
MGGPVGEVAEKRKLATPKSKLNRLSDRLFNALADPTRRAIFERLSQGSEVTVRELVAYSGVSQQAVAKHVGVLQVAGLVDFRRQYGTNFYSARPRGAAPLLKWLAQQGILREPPTATRFAQARAGSPQRRVASSALPTPASSTSSKSKA